VYRIEEAEGRGADRIDTLQEVARAMDCELIYAIVPRRGKTLEKTAEHLREWPKWRTPKQEERRKKASEAEDRRFCAEHWAWVREKKEQEEESQRVVSLGLKLARELPGEERRRAEAAAKTGKPLEVGWVAKWVYERWEALDKQIEEEKAARKSKGKGSKEKVRLRPGDEAPAAWKAAQTAEQMEKHKVPGDWALKIALDSAKVKEKQGRSEAGGKAHPKRGVDATLDFLRRMDDLHGSDRAE
jgi:hypothetical protein